MVFENNEISFQNRFINVANEYNKLKIHFQSPNLVYQSFKCYHSDISTYENDVTPSIRSFTIMEFHNIDTVPENKNKILRQILIDENENTNLNYERLAQAYLYIQKNLKTSENDLFLTYQGLIDVNNLILNVCNSCLRLKQVKPKGYNYHYMDYRKITFHLQIIIDDWNARYLTVNRFIKYFLQIHPFLDGNGRTCKSYLLDFSKENINLDNGSATRFFY